MDGNGSQEDEGGVITEKHIKGQHYAVEHDQYGIAKIKAGQNNVIHSGEVVNQPTRRSNILRVGEYKPVGLKPLKKVS